MIVHVWSVFNGDGVWHCLRVWGSLTAVVKRCEPWCVCLFIFAEPWMEVWDALTVRFMTVSLWCVCVCCDVGKGACEFIVTVSP